METIFKRSTSLNFGLTLPRGSVKSESFLFGLDISQLGILQFTFECWASSLTSQGIARFVISKFLNFN